MLCSLSSFSPWPLSSFPRGLAVSILPSPAAQYQASIASPQEKCCGESYEMEEGSSPSCLLVSDITHPKFFGEVSLMQPDILTRRLFVTSSLLPVPLPDRRETHFWYVAPEEVQNESILNGYLELISPSERESVLRMNGEKLQKSALLARALVRTTLARYTNGKVCPRALRFKKNMFGKPEVDWQNDENWVPPSLNFNMSHSSSLIACGVTIDVRIGIDVEEKLRQLRNNVASFAQRYFSSHEVNFLQSFSNPDIQRQEFIKLWTLKEAYVKALGRGFSAAPFKDFTIQFEASNKTRFQRQPDQAASKIVVEACGDSKTLTSDWQFALFELANSHYVAICMEKDDNIEGGAENSLKLKAWKTIPFVKDECVSGTDAVVAITGFS